MKKTESHSYDLIVVGGGMSGLIAAIEAARQGVRTALVHSRAVLGGNASSEIRIHINSASDGARKPDLEETGILYELMLKNKAVNPLYNYNIWDVVLFEAAKNEPNLSLFLNTHMVDAFKEGNRITSIFCFQETTEKHIYMSAPLFVDATGNGTLGYFVDALFRTGSESKDEFNEPHAPSEANNERMGNTILFRAVDVGHPVKFTPPSFAKKLTEEDLRFRVHSSTHKMDFSQAEDPEDYKRTSATSSSCSDYGYWWLELMGQDEDIINDFETIRDELYAWLYGVWDHIKNGGDHGAENYELIWVGSMPGMRESRRLVGDYLLNENDIWEHRFFDDAVCYGGWSVDLHVSRGLEDLDKLPSKCWNFDGAYTIPYRCFYSKNIDNLFMAGRNISCSRLAMASTRIIATCAIGGQAVGMAAALASKYNCMPRDVLFHMDELQQALLKNDIFIPGVLNHDKNDKALLAHIDATSFINDDVPENVCDGISRHYEGKRHCWSAMPGETLTLSWNEPVSLSQLRFTFQSNFNYPIRITMAPKRQAQQRTGVPIELVKDFRIRLFDGENCVLDKTVTDNVLRLCIVDFEKTTCTRAEITPISTNGADVAELLEVRAY